MSEKVLLIYTVFFEVDARTALLDMLSLPVSQEGVVIYYPCFLTVDNGYVIKQCS
jgi:hypothetical protein